MLAIVLDDIGPGGRLTQRAIRLPAPVTLSFLPYANDLSVPDRRGAAHGHEIFLHLPMEPIGHADPGPNAILVGLDPGELQRRLAWAFDRVPRRHGHEQSHGQPGQSDPATMLKVLQEARRHGLSFVDSRTSPLSVGDAPRGTAGHAARRARRVPRQRPVHERHPAAAGRSRALRQAAGLRPGDRASLPDDAGRARSLDARGPGARPADRHAPAS